MKPTDFEYANLNFVGGSSGRTVPIGELPVWTDKEQCVSLWSMSWRERLSALLFGRVWVNLLCGGRHPPIAVECRHSYLYEVIEE